MSESRQTTAHVFLVRPARFTQNPETLESNAFQKPVTLPPDTLAQAARDEFDGVVRALRGAGVEAIVFEDTQSPVTPDAVFPNNWITTHADGRVFLFPMESPARRLERRMDIVEALAGDHGFAVTDVVDLSPYEQRGSYLEGTGSMVFDRPGRLAFAALSSRTHAPVLAEFARLAGYEICAFHAADAGGRTVYHTNVMLAIGEKFAVLCADAIVDTVQRDAVLRRLFDTGRQVIPISFAQLAAFAGNLLEMRSAAGEAVLAISTRAREALSANQLASLEACGQVLAVEMDSIEAAGGGSVRCMIAEIFLPRPPR